MTQTTLEEVKAGCEPFAADGFGDNAQIGALVIHGFTGSPDSTTPWARHLNGHGYRVNALRLPGHGTTWQDANTRSFTEIQNAVDAAFQEMRDNSGRVFLMAQSFGCALALRIAAENPDSVAGVVLVNPWVRADGVASWQRHLVPIQKYLAMVVSNVPGVASDIADQSSRENGYEKVPVKLAASLVPGLSALRNLLPRVTAPVQMHLSAVDHVLSTNNAQLIRASVRSPIEEVTLANSFHVATLDYDAEEIFKRSVQFIEAHR